MAVGVVTVAAACAGDDGGTSGAGASVEMSTATTSPVTESTEMSAVTSVAATVAATSDASTTTAVVPPTTATEPPVTPSGFESVAATVTTADGEVCELCLWLADSSRGRSQGLMGVTDLGAADGMAFVYPSPHTGSFWMKNTLLPLSIAFFDDRGVYLDAFDMEPCTADPCPLYPTAPDFTVAIEVVEGDLPSLGLEAGSRLRLTGVPCR